MQIVKQCMDKVVKHANVTKKRKARKEPSHMRWDEEESDTEFPPPRKKQKQVRSICIYIASSQCLQCPVRATVAYQMATVALMRWHALPNKTC